MQEIGAAGARPAPQRPWARGIRYRILATVLTNGLYLQAATSELTPRGSAFDGSGWEPFAFTGCDRQLQE